eukprot:TRINITY_DN2824_c0_g1_i3.p1 TRINITY_DN2824_c0_g1~~TRINITY_DN2824_c0_g1_i3.p1  ORF type:complete len:298 (-),score=54.85 TRINITY_DN2824_c0_g1_i3:32-865(-)
MCIRDRHGGLLFITVRFQRRNMPQEHHKRSYAEPTVVRETFLQYATPTALVAQAVPIALPNFQSRQPLIVSATQITTMSHPAPVIYSQDMPSLSHRSHVVSTPNRVFAPPMVATPMAMLAPSTPVRVAAFQAQGTQLSHSIATPTAARVLPQFTPRRSLAPAPAQVLTQSFVPTTPTRVATQPTPTRLVVEPPRRARYVDEPDFERPRQPQHVSIPPSEFRNDNDIPRQYLKKPQREPARRYIPPEYNDPAPPRPSGPPNRRPNSRQSPLDDDFVLC